MKGSEFGRFPFGQPNTQRPMRRPKGAARALVVGVYPSAFHIAWSPPERLDTRDVASRRRPAIGSLAVDVEPVVFWDGIDPDPQRILDEWKQRAGFDPEKHGSATLGTNGPSGAGLIDNALTPLGLDPNVVAFTDAVPWYFVKQGAKSQGEAMATRFAPVAAEMGVHPGSLRSRPSTRALVEIARSDVRRQSLRAEVVEADAPLVITLGQEALDAVRSVADGCGGVQTKLAAEGYGARGELVINGRPFEFLPLVHPGFERQTKNPDWVAALASWRTRPR